MQRSASLLMYPLGNLQMPHNCARSNNLARRRLPQNEIRPRALEGKGCWWGCRTEDNPRKPWSVHLVEHYIERVGFTYYWQIFLGAGVEVREKVGAGGCEFAVAAPGQDSFEK
jgi:hypothetical protein